MSCQALQLQCDMTAYSTVTVTQEAEKRKTKTYVGLFTVLQQHISTKDSPQFCGKWGD